MIIYLTGFMGAGKSHLARQLAKILNLPLIDLDSEIERKTGNSISELFESSGEKAFRKAEYDQLSHFSRRTPDFVMACGGGILNNIDNLMLMQQYGIVVFVDTKLSVIKNRLLKQKENRPLLAGLSDEACLQRIDELYKQRLPYYRKSDVSYKPHIETPEDLLRKIKLF
ncbi:MAG: shikimate kinase [Bacteroidota bacterium]